MSERVQLNLEHQIAELRDLQEKKIFTSVRFDPLSLSAAMAYACVYAARPRSLKLLNEEQPTN